jgi:hypothetical protein
LTKYSKRIFTILDAGREFTFIVADANNDSVIFEPNEGDMIYLNGELLADGATVKSESFNIGDSINFKTVKMGDNKWSWHARSLLGDWVASQ